MKYVLVYLLKGKIANFHQKLVKKIAAKFNEFHLIENPIPCHITLKTPFKNVKIRQIEIILEKFAREHKSAKIRIDGFGNFKNCAAYLNVGFSEEAKRIQKDLLIAVKDISEIKVRKFDRKHNPHITLAYAANKKNFKLILRHLKGLEKPEFSVRLDNIAILKKQRNSWKAHKIYRLAKN